VSDEDQFIPPMPEDRFWALVEKSDGDAERLKTVLLALPAEDICAFSLALDDMMYALDRRDIHDVTDGSDDGFEYMRLWIISRGRAYCESVIADPHNAPQWGDEENEDFGYVAEDAFEAKEGAPFPTSVRRHKTSRFLTGSNTAGWAESN
jgi:Protein of unknown function (DUF4240)